METEEQDMTEPDDARISVAQVAQEVAADLEDYVVLDSTYYEGYRTADAQEMIERAFAPLEVENQELKEAARLITHFNKQLQAELEEAKERATKADEMRGEALLALGIMQNERDAAERHISREGRISDSEMMALLRRVNKQMEAELNEAKAINSAAHDQLAEAYRQNEGLRARLATAEAELRNIATADLKTWHEDCNTPVDFMRWAQNRARYALAKGGA